MNERGDNVRVWVSVGSNIDPERHISQALQDLMAQVRVVAVSEVLCTPALHRPDDPDFCNTVWELRTDLSPQTLKFDVLRPIEAKHRRRRNPEDSFAPRTLDLDLVLYNGIIVDTPELKLPHPDLQRWFVAAGVVELAGDMTYPGTNRRIGDVLNTAPPDNEKIRRMDNLTLALRNRLEQI